MCYLRASLVGLSIQKEMEQFWANLTYLKDRFNYEYLTLRFGYPHILLVLIIAELQKSQPHPLIIPKILHYFTWCKSHCNGYGYSPSKVASSAGGLRNPNPGHCKNGFDWKKSTVPWQVWESSWRKVQRASGW